MPRVRDARVVRGGELRVPRAGSSASVDADCCRPLPIRLSRHFFSSFAASIETGFASHCGLTCLLGMPAL